MVEVRKTLEQRVIETAAPMEALRFSIMTNLEADIDTEMSKDSSSNMHAGEKVSIWFILKYWVDSVLT